MFERMSQALLISWFTGNPNLTTFLQYSVHLSRTLQLVRIYSPPLSISRSIWELEIIRESIDHGKRPVKEFKLTGSRLIWPISARFTSAPRMVICDRAGPFCTMLAGPARGLWSEVRLSRGERLDWVQKGLGVRRFLTKRKMGCLCRTLPHSEVNQPRQEH